MKKINLSGITFGRLLVLREDGKRNGITKWLCRCDCGNEISAFGNNLRRLHTTSCGCFKYEQISKAKKIHGRTGTKEYLAWCNMRRRCEDSSSQNYHRYGGRGISVCDEWKSFERFYADMGEAPAGETLERKNNNGNYEKNNCRWASRMMQANNRSTNTIIEFNGIKKTMSEWIRGAGIKSSTFWQRYSAYGWSFEKSISTPVLRSR